jgi:hypothetical protein
MLEYGREEKVTSVLVVTAGVTIARYAWEDGCLSA